MISLNDINSLLKSFLNIKITTQTHKIVFYPPVKSNISTDTKTLINIYLFEIRENIEAKSNQWERNHNDTRAFKKEAPILLDLFYMISLYGASSDLESRTEEELQLLSYLLPLVYHQKALREEDVALELAPLFNQLEQDNPSIPIESIHPKFLDEQGAFQLWNSFEQASKPAIYLKVTAPIIFAKEDAGAIVLNKKLKMQRKV